mmetsp:Transcript_30335/g.94158  ORF Transcript_30335/g.94158 Transcript_30335/m.94158 type:complete len:537 (-) Transcript_30335:43-1653(-)
MAGPRGAAAGGRQQLAAAGLHDRARRDRRGHRVHALHRGSPAVQVQPPGALHGLVPHLLHSQLQRAEDEAHAALRQGSLGPRRPAGPDHLQKPRPCPGGDAEEDREPVQHPGRAHPQRARREEPLPRARGSRAAARRRPPQRRASLGRLGRRGRAALQPGPHLALAGGLEQLRAARGRGRGGAAGEDRLRGQVQQGRQRRLPVRPGRPAPRGRRGGAEAADRVDRRRGPGAAHGGDRRPGEARARPLRRGAAARGRRHLRAGRLRRPRHRGQGQGCGPRTRVEEALLRGLLGHASGADPVRAGRPGPRGRHQRGVRQGQDIAEPHPGVHARDLQRDHGRQHAPREPLDRVPQPLHGPRRGPLRRRAARAGAAPTPLRVQREVQGEDGGQRLGLLGTGRGQGAHGRHRAAALRTPLLLGGAVPPRVQVSAGLALAALLRLCRRGEQPRQGAGHGRRLPAEGAELALDAVLHLSHGVGPPPDGQACQGWRVVPACCGLLLCWGLGVAARRAQGRWILPRGAAEVRLAGVTSWGCRALE